jgi:hypothetical protein
MRGGEGQSRDAVSYQKISEIGEGKGLPRAAVSYNRLATIGEGRECREMPLAAKKWRK